VAPLTRVTAHACFFLHAPANVHLAPVLLQSLVNVMRSIETWYAKDKPHLARRLGRGLSKTSEAAASDGGSEGESVSETERGEPQGGPALVAAVEALESAEQDASSQLLLSQAGQFEKMKTQKQLVEEAVFQVSHPRKGRRVVQKGSGGDLW